MDALGFFLNGFRVDRILAMGEGCDNSGHAYVLLHTMFMIHVRVKPLLFYKDKNTHYYCNNVC